MESWRMGHIEHNNALKSIANLHAAPQGNTFIWAKQNVFLSDAFYSRRCFWRLLINQKSFISSQRGSWSYGKAAAASLRLVWWRRVSLCLCQWQFRTNAKIAGCLFVFLSVYPSATGTVQFTLPWQNSAAGFFPTILHCCGPTLGTKYLICWWWKGKVRLLR